MVYKIVSGGQTGVDRAALDFAIAEKMSCGGWVPQGRLAEDGPLDPKYPLVETPTATYSQRTEWNVRDSEGTLVLTWGATKGGTLKTMALAQRLKKPALLINMTKEKSAADVRKWLEQMRVHVLNVAGPRHSEEPRAYEEALAFLKEIFSDEAE